MGSRYVVDSKGRDTSEHLAIKKGRIKGKAAVELPPFLNFAVLPERDFTRLVGEVQDDFRPASR